MHARHGWFYGIFATLLAVDQASKAWTREALDPGQSLPYPLPGVFELTLTYNEGIAFGLFQGLGVFTAPIAILIAVVAAVYSHRALHEGRLIHFALGLLASGSIGNLIDRLWLGKVTDMFWIRLINFPVFNVADACITVGAGLLAYKWTREAFESDSEPTTDTSEEAAPSDATRR